jgi:hypothetical protein
MKSGLTILLLGALSLPVTAAAFYTNQNFWTTAHEAPAWFESDGAGGFYGETEEGTMFTQKPVTNSFNIKLHKFSIDAAYFYISDKGVIKAPNDLIALSIYFTLS